MAKKNCFLCGGTGVRNNGYFNYSCQCSSVEINPIQGTLLESQKIMFFDEDDLSVIRELLSEIACGYERTTFYHHCCDANEIVKKIDDYLGIPETED